MVLSLAIVDHKIFATENNESNQIVQNDGENKKDDANGQEKNTNENNSNQTNPQESPDGGDSKGNNTNGDANNNESGEEPKEGDSKEGESGNEQTGGSNSSSSGTNDNGASQSNSSSSINNNEETKSNKSDDKGNSSSSSTTGKGSDSKNEGAVLKAQDNPLMVITDETVIPSGGVWDGVDITISTGVILGPTSGSATLRNCTITNDANNSRTGGYSSTNGSALICRAADGLRLDNVTINSSENTLALNIFNDSSISANNLTLNGSANASNDTPFLLVGGYPSGRRGSLNFSGSSSINGAKGSVIGNGNSEINVTSGTLTIKDSDIKLNSGVKIIVKSGATLVFDNSTYSQTEKLIVLEDGATLRLINGAQFTTSPNAGLFEVGNGTTLAVESGSTFNLNVNAGMSVAEGGTLEVNAATLNVNAGGIANNGGTVAISNGATVNGKSDSTKVVTTGNNFTVDSSSLNTVWIDNSNKADIKDSDLNNCVIKTRANTMLNISGSKLHDSTRTSQETMIHTSGNGATVNISDTEICDNVNNMGAGNPGASIVKVENGTINLSGVIVQKNSCKTRGGAFYLMNSVLHIDDNSTFKNNSAQFLGGVIFMSGTTATIGAATFEHNGWQSAERVTGQGGVIYAQEGSAITLNGTKFESNHAWNGNGGVGENGAGGAIFITGGMSSINVYGAQFTNNKAQARGGALVVSGASHAQITDLSGTPTVFSGNSVDSGVDFAGGGLFIDTSYVKMWDAAVYNNAAPDAGGAISTCATGTAQVWSLDGAAIFDNDVSNANSLADPEVSNYKDLYVLTKNHRDVDTGELVDGRNGFDVDREFEVVERMFNNGLHRWSVKNLESNQDGHHFHSLIAQSDPTSRNTSRAKVVFTDNSVVKDQSNSRVVSGGAIGCNGLLEIGTDTEIKVVKVWEDDHNNDGYRPTMEEFANDITVLANGQELSEEVKQKLRVNVMDLAEHSYVLSDNVLDYEGEARDYTGKDAWIVVISGLPVVDGNNKKITYTVAEKPIQRYRSEVPDEEEGVHFNQDTYFEIENYHTNETMDLKVHKSWRDHENAHNVRPDTVTVNLYANDELIRELTLSKDNDWSTEVKNLPKYSGGKEIRYEMAEPNIESHYFFTFEKSGDTIECENNYKIGNVSVPVHKVWNDNDDAAQARPQSITVRLMARIGEHNEETDKTLTLSADNDWSGTFENLPDSADGEKINYWVDEVSVDHH